MQTVQEVGCNEPASFMAMVIPQSTKNFFTGVGKGIPMEGLLKRANMRNLKGSEKKVSAMVHKTVYQVMQ